MFDDFPILLPNTGYQRISRNFHRMYFHVHNRCKTERFAANYSIARSATVAGQTGTQSGFAQCGFKLKNLTPKIAGKWCLQREDTENSPDG
jgi:hypothetical protein